MAMGAAALARVRANFGGDYPDQVLQSKIDAIGMELLRKGAGPNPYSFEFTVLADAKSIQAVALPGGQILLTFGLYKLLQSDQEIAAVMSHEIAHVLARHATARLVQKEWRGAEAEGERIADACLDMHYNSSEEYEADELSVRILADSGYDPNSMLRVMEALERISAGAPSTPSIWKMHPNPADRAGRIAHWIEVYTPAKKIP
jgi:predicted Zn-dependent protease